MAVLGLILLVAAGVLTAAVVTSNTGAIETDLWGVTISNLSLGVLFVAGMLTTLIGVAGLVLMLGGLRRGRRLRHERKTLRRENQRLVQQVDTTPGPDDTTEYPTESRYQENPTRLDERPADTSGRRLDGRDDGVNDSTRRHGRMDDRGEVADRRGDGTDTTVGYDRAPGGPTRRPG